MDREEESRLIKSIRKGNLQDFERIIDSYEKVLLHIAFYTVGNREDAEDLCQETFIKLFKHIRSFIPRKGSLKNYLYRTLINLCYSHLTKKKRFTINVLEEENFTSEVKEEKGEISSIINKLLKFLSPRERIVFVLKEIEDLEYNEIAKMLKLNEITIRRHNSMARQKLKELIEKNYPEYGRLYEKNT